MLSSFVLASDPLELEVVDSTSGAFPTEEAVFIIKVSNNMGKADKFRVYVDPVGVAPFSEIFDAATFNKSDLELNAFSSELVELRVKTSENVVPSVSYGLTLFAKSTIDSSIRAEKDLTIRVIKPESVVKIEAFDFKIKPKDEIELKFSFKNLLKNDFPKAEVYVSSDFLEYRTSMRIAPHQSREDVFTIPMDTSAVAGKHTVSVRVYDGQTVIGILEYEVAIVESESVGENVKHSTFILDRVTTVVKSNDGNVPVEEVYQFRLNPIKRLITGFDPEPDVKGKNTIWRFNLKPGEEEVIVITERYNYMALVVLVLALLAGLVHYWTKKDIEVTKKVFRFKDDKGIGEVKVMISIHNKSRNVFRNVKIIEVIPGLIKPTGDFGTLKPSKNMVGDKIRSLIWTLPILDKGEERILTYKIKPSLNIVGRVVLPATLIKFVKKNKNYEVRSNVLGLESE